MKRRPPLLALAVLAPVLAIAGCGQDGPGKTEGTKIAKDERASLATTYWKARDALPAAMLDEPDGVGMFRACTAKEKNGKGNARYDLADYLEPRQDTETMAHLLATVKTALAPQGWRFASVFVPDSAMPDPTTERLYQWQAKQGGLYMELTLHDADKNKRMPAAGYLDVLTGCRTFGAAQKELLAHYGDTRRDHYRATSKATPNPIPTAFPTSGL